jgi:hypothetical protein
MAQAQVNLAQAEDTQAGQRKLSGAIWELELGERHFNSTTLKSTCICKCKVDANDPTIVCGKKLQLTQASTSSLRHHIKSQHPLEWAKVVKLEAERVTKATANKVTLAKVIAEQEGSIEEEDQATPGPSRKRAAPGEGDLFETPKAKRPATTHLSGESLFPRVTKFNVRDKKQIYWDLRLTHLMVGNNLPNVFVADDITKGWMDEFQPQYHLKHASTFSR